MKPEQQINSDRESWLTPDEAAQVLKIAAMRKLFAGNHRDYFYTESRTQHEFTAVGKNAANVLYITENLAGRCSLKYADLLFGEELAVEPATPSAELAAAIARVGESSKIHAVLYEAAVTASWRGKTYVQFYVMAGKVVAENVQPENIFPVYAPGTGTLQSAEIKFEVAIGGKKYLRVIRHLPGLIQHELYELMPNGGKGAPADLALVGAVPEQKTGIDELTVIELENFTNGGRGVSDYDGTETLADEVNNRRSQISRVLDKHGDPAMQVLESCFDDDGTFRISGRAIKIDDMSKDAVKYLTWEAQLEWQFKALVDATLAYCGQMEMAPQLVGMGGGTSADSWKKFKLAMTQTLARVNRKQLFMSPGIKAIFRVAFKLENAFSLFAYAIVPVSLTFSDGLPTDDLELMQVVVGYRNAGLMSLEMSLTWIHGDPKIVALELARITKEVAASLPTGIVDVTGHVHEQIPPDTQPGAAVPQQPPQSPGASAPAGSGSLA